MAIEDDFGHDPLQPSFQDYTLSASGLVSRTFSLWSRKIVQYIMIVGVIAAVFVVVSFVILYAIFDIIGTLGTDPLGYLLSLIFIPETNIVLLAVTAGFGIIAFVVNAIIYGAAIKFTLDEYTESRGDVGASFSHSFSRLLNLILVQLILSFIVAIVLTPATILTARAMGMIDISDPFNPIILPGAFELLLSAMAFFIIGGIFLLYLQVRFAPTLAIVIDSELSAIESLKRSWELTGGNFFHVLGSLILFNLVVLVIGLIVGMVLAVTLLPASNLIVIEAVVSALLFSSLTYIFTAVLYRDLSSRKGTSEFPEYVL